MSHVRGRAAVQAVTRKPYLVAGLAGAALGGARGAGVAVRVSAGRQHAFLVVGTALSLLAAPALGILEAEVVGVDAGAVRAERWDREDRCGEESNEREGGRCFHQEWAW